MGLRHRSDQLEKKKIVFRMRIFIRMDSASPIKPRTVPKEEFVILILASQCWGMVQKKD